jgi:hypothetical protein
MRNTVKICDLKKHANDMLRNSDDSKKEGRIAIALLLEKILMDAGAYHGFGYLGEKEVPKGHTYGINHDNEGNVVDDYKERFLNTDDTRRCYL